VSSYYAEALLQHAQRALRVVPLAEMAEAFAAIDTFVGEPSGPTFLAAQRALRHARRQHASKHLAESHAGRNFREGLEAVRAAPGLDPAHAEALARLPLDVRTGQRLLALAQLLEIHVELSGRAAAASRELKKKLESIGQARERAPTTWRDAGPPRR
jgi:hypothetical protein